MTRLKYMYLWQEEYRQLILLSEANLKKKIIKLLHRWKQRLKL